jgi:hypothetical protein
MFVFLSLYLLWDCPSCPPEGFYLFILPPFWNETTTFILIASVADPKLLFRIRFRIRILDSDLDQKLAKFFFCTKIFTQPHLQGCPPSAL